MAPSKQHRIKGVTIVEPAGHSGHGEVEPGNAPVLSLVYASGQRPTLDAVADLTARPGAIQRFSISHIPQGDAVWAELLSAGLTYDCRGLAPGEPAAPPGRGTMLGLADIDRKSVV